tara:strand:- start:4036 stop:4323 length:288 start_codon:yes stop_codon:yes gene_type:complete
MIFTQMTFAPASDPDTFVVYFTDHGETQTFPFLGFQIISEHHDNCGWIIKKVPMSFGDDGDDEYAILRRGIYYYDEQKFKTVDELKLYRDDTKSS